MLVLFILFLEQSLGLNLLRMQNNKSCGLDSLIRTLSKTLSLFLSLKDKIHKATALLKTFISHNDILIIIKYLGKNVKPKECYRAE